MFYRIVQNAQRKLLLLLAMAEQFIQNYLSQKDAQQRKTKKQRDKRIKQLKLTSQSNFKTIEPVSVQQINLEQTFVFFNKIKTTLKQMFRQNFSQQASKHKIKLIRMLSKEHETDEINEQKQSNKQNGPTTFITCDINTMSMSQNLPHVDLMQVSNFPQNMSEMIHSPTKNKPQNKNKFHSLKAKASQLRLRIHPAVNKYQSRKKQEIRLFLQLNQKTEHLQNFRSDQGKFFKFNQNLKITIKNVNMCRLVLLGKKNAVIEQFNRIGDDQYFKQLNQKINPHNIELKKKNSQSPFIKEKNQHQDQSNNQQHFSNTFASSFAPCAFKQKALRIKNYFEQTSTYFNTIQAFLIQFIKKDKAYENYLKQNRLKSKLKIYQKNTQTQKFYIEFIDRCFHMSEISRLYFNVLNQLTLQNICLKESKLLHKEQIEAQNRVLIELRYVLIYLQKECENTAQNTFFNRTQSLNFFSKNNTIRNNPMISQQPSSRQNMNELRKSIQLLKKASQKGLVLKESQKMLPINKLEQSTNISRKTSQMPLNNLVVQAIAQMFNVPNNNNFQVNKNTRQKKSQPQRTSNCLKDKDIDINQIWKTFYNKKFSSNAMRLRMY